MSCRFDPDPDSDSDQVALGGLHPGLSCSAFIEKTAAYSLTPGKDVALASAPLASFAGSPYAGSYAERLPRLVKVRLRAGRLDPSRGLR